MFDKGVSKCIEVIITSKLRWDKVVLYVRQKTRGGGGEEEEEKE